MNPESTLAAPRDGPAALRLGPAPAANGLRIPHLLAASGLSAGGLHPLQGLHVDEVLVLAHDVSAAHRLEELLGPVEVVQADPYAAQRLRHVPVGAGAGDDPVLGGEALRLLV